MPSYTFKPLFCWLLSICLLIWLMIMVGGLTRLTQAGLSIVEWQPISGISPPLTTRGWQEAFAAYKQFPEYQQLYPHMTLEKFKFIFWMEFSHRLLGRFIGLWVLCPLIYFWLKQSLPLWLRLLSLGILALGFLQGIVGWYMVKSGLSCNPSVSHYRLTLHLILALTLYALLFWAALKLYPSPPLQTKGYLIPSLLGFSCVLVVITIIYGALVAGLKAGLIHNSFPLMGETILPSDWMFLKPVWLNFWENPATVQFLHRWLAMGSLGTILMTAFFILHSFPTVPSLRKAVLALVGTVILQVILGICTLLYQVPVLLAVMHQGNAVLLLTLLLYLLFKFISMTRVTSQPFLKAIGTVEKVKAPSREASRS